MSVSQSQGCFLALTIANLTAPGNRLLKSSYCKNCAALTAIASTLNIPNTCAHFKLPLPPYGKPKIVNIPYDATSVGPHCCLKEWSHRGIAPLPETVNSSYAVFSPRQPEMGKSPDFATLLCGQMKASDHSLEGKNLPRTYTE
jgi:hypothetical protein